MLAPLLWIHYLIAQTFAQTLSSSDSNEEFDSLDTEDTTQIHEIHILQTGDDLQFTCIGSYELPKAYQINAIMHIMVQSELAEQLALEDKNRKFHRIPLKKGFDMYDEAAASINHYHVTLAHLGDFCFIKLPSETTDITLNRDSYCFRVLPRHSPFTDHQVIYIEHSVYDVRALKHAIQRKLHIDTNTKYKDKGHSPTIIGINVAFETHAILVRELQWEKLLFLVQHIVDQLLPFLSSDDLIVTLPISNKLKGYKRATASERVALVVHNARKQRKELKETYELQYSMHTESTFGGSIVFAKHLHDHTHSSNVPSSEIHLADFVVSIGSSASSKNTDAIAISVQHSQTKDHVCFSKVEIFDYDYLFDVATKTTKCILNAMGVSNANALNIYIKTDPNGSSNTAVAHGIQFELTVQGGECCVIQIAPNSIHHTLYQDDKASTSDNTQQIILLKGSKLTVVPSPAVAKVASNVVFYVDFLGFDDGTDWSSHSKIESLHYLLYSWKEYVSISNGLFYICASWTQKAIQTTKCSDDLYFNVDFLLTKEDQPDVSAADSSGFMALQLVHLQSLYKTILDTRNELNQQTQNEMNVRHNLMLREFAASSDKHHLKQFEQIYESEMDKNGETQARRRDLQNQLKLIQQRLQNDEAFEKQYADALKTFERKDIKDPMKKRAELMDQITMSQQQMIRLDLEIKQKQQMLRSLQQQIDSIEIHAT
eukprot:88306_1